MWKFRRTMPILLKLKLTFYLKIEIVYNRIEIEKIQFYCVSI